MNDDDTKPWFTATTTKRWRSYKKLTPEERREYDAMFSGRSMTVQINAGGVTVNGQHYASLDDVPQADREYIENHFKGSFLGRIWNKEHGGEVDGTELIDMMANIKASPEWTVETDLPDTSPMPFPRAHPASFENLQSDPVPGAVSKGGGLRKALLISIAIGLALWAAQALRLF